MTKENFITLILSTIGGILFALGMCMAMLPEWNAFTQGTIIGAMGLVVLIAMILVRRKMAGKPVIVKLTAKTAGIVLLGIVGAAALGVGLCLVMVWNYLMPGVAVGIVGIMLLLCLIPMVKGIV